MFLSRSTVWADNNPICVRLKRKECAVKATFIWVAVEEILILLNNKNIYAECYKKKTINKNS